MTEDRVYEMDWGSFRGSREVLKWNRKNLQVMGAVVDRYVKIEKRRTAVTAGGCVGVFPKYLAPLFGRVITFEPDHDNFACFAANLEDTTNVIKIQAALGFQRASVRTAKVNKWGRTHEGVTHLDGEGIIPTLRVDDLGLNDVDFLLLDTEGHELEALRGASKTITDCRPVIMCEINKNAKLNGWELRDAEALLDGYAYDLAEVIGADKVFMPRERAIYKKRDQ